VDHCVSGRRIRGKVPQELGSVGPPSDHHRGAGDICDVADVADSRVDSGALHESNIDRIVGDIQRNFDKRVCSFGLVVFYGLCDAEA